jgi:hypothetical protein
MLWEMTLPLLNVCIGKWKEHLLAGKKEGRSVEKSPSALSSMAFTKSPTALSSLRLEPEETQGQTHLISQISVPVSTS